MCPKCRFGPIDKRNCDNLQSHHGEVKNGTKINNACPDCNFFSPKIQDWLKWDGQFKY